MSVAPVERLDISLVWITHELGGQEYTSTLTHTQAQAHVDSASGSPVPVHLVVAAASPWEDERNWPGQSETNLACVIVYA